MCVTEDGRSIGKYNSNLPLKEVAISVDNKSVEKQLKDAWQRLFK